ncbi:MAG: hypothetical protein M3R36_18845 [Bacteroidota bacterium]|nr:hypothetical protein [Bacteroidota bacterium]
MKKLFLFFCIVLFSSQVFAQANLDENFNYPAGDSIGAHGWVYFSGVANTILVTSPGLTYAGYPLSGIGNATTLNTNGNDNYKSLSSTADSNTTNSIYASFMVRVDSATAQGDYFLAFLPNNSTTFFEGRVQARLRSGNLNFGITKANSSSDTNVAGIWTTSNYSLGVTYLLVLKYTFVLGNSRTNDQVSLFVLSSGVPATEPTPTLGPNTYPSFDAENIGRIALRQGGAARAPIVVVDGIRVATSWFPLIVDIKLAIQGLVLGSASIIDTVEVYLRNATTPYSIVDSSTSAVNFIGGVTTYSIFSFPNATSGTYYYDVRYRHLPVFRNGIETWSKNGGESISRFSWNPYDFTTAASQAFGSNQILLGSTYAMYNGDVNQDDVVDLADVATIDNDAFNFASGYLNTDLDGNNIVDISDAAVADNNAFNFVGAVIPS